MRRLDRRRRIDFVDLSGAGETFPSCPLERREMLARLHAQEEGGPLVNGAEAFAAMWRAIPLLAPIGHALKWRPLLRLAESIYLIFLRVRPSLQRLFRG